MKVQVFRAWINVTQNPYRFSRLQFFSKHVQCSGMFCHTAAILSICEWKWFHGKLNTGIFYGSQDRWQIYGKTTRQHFPCNNRRRISRLENYVFRGYTTYFEVRKIRFSRLQRILRLKHTFSEVTTYFKVRKSRTKYDSETMMLKQDAWVSRLCIIYARFQLTLFQKNNLPQKTDLKLFVFIRCIFGEFVWEIARFEKY